MNKIDLLLNLLSDNRFSKSNTRICYFIFNNPRSTSKDIVRNLHMQAPNVNRELKSMTIKGFLHRENLIYNREFFYSVNLDILRGEL